MAYAIAAFYAAYIVALALSIKGAARAGEDDEI